MMNLKFKFICLLLLTQLNVKAELRLPALVADHMVLQRDIKIPVWGWATPNEKIEVTFKNKTYNTVTAEDGKWMLKMDASKAGGPYVLHIKSASEQKTIKDVLLGDVWICSGQSNMVFDFNNGRARALYAQDIASSRNKNIRQVIISRVTNHSPTAAFSTSGWREASPETLNAFSVAAYFFAKDLYDQYKIPIGLINSSWGGTKIEAWMSEDAIKVFPQFEKDVKLLKDTVQISSNIAERKKRIEDWHLSNKTADKGYLEGKAVWADIDFNDKDWKAIETPTLFEKFGFSNTFGVIWFRKEIEVASDLAGKSAVLKLGIIDDEDETFINGVRVGGFAHNGKPRLHNVPADLLKAGKNVIAIRITNWYGSGGFVGNQPIELDFGTSKIAVSGTWKYQMGRKAEQLPGPYNVQDLSTSLYNGMIAPLIPYGIKGVIWYQGENNGSRGKEYQRLLPAMIADWRGKWQQGDFPFVYQQLVNFKPEQKQPSESEWAELREAQLMTLQKSPNTAMAVGIDIGEANDIHPVNKKDVGKRLALGARKIAYGEKRLVSSGPLYKSVKINRGKAILDFSSVGNGLATSDGSSPKYFAIAGADRKFYWAEAQIKGKKIEVSSKSVPNPVAVRYAWADNPQGCNLINKNGLPASPFRTDNWSRR